MLADWGSFWMQLSQKEKEGIRLFLKASALERKGEIGQAIEFYGQAYRLDPEVEKHVDVKDLRPPSVDPNNNQAIERPVFDIQASDSSASISAALALEAYPHQPLGLEDELFLRILKWAGAIHPPSVDTIGKTCRKSYLLSRRAEVWQHLYNLTFTNQALIPRSVKMPSEDFRKAFLVKSRLRTDGIYINKMTYFRPGLSYTSLTNPVHLVTYYRYLRFFGSTQGYSVWWLISSKPPKDIIEHLRHPYRNNQEPDALALDFSSLALGQFANFFHGQWQPDYKNEEDGHFSLCLASTSRSKVIKWRMNVYLEPNTRKRPVQHGRLMVSEYVDVDHGTEISTDDWGRFTFSKVKSFYT